MNNALAENKILILYTLENCKLNLTKAQFSNVILESVYINYFELQQYIEELIKTGLVELDVFNDKEVIVISAQGKSVLEMFKDRIQDRKKKEIDRYLIENINQLIKETTISHALSEGSQGTYQVTLIALESKEELIKLEMNFPTKDTAQLAIQNWKNKSTQIYEILYKELTKKVK